MPPTTAQHPSPAELTAFALGKLDQNMTEWVGRHLADCSTCRTVVERTPADSLVNRLAAAPAGATGPWISVAETQSGAPPPPPIAPEDVPPALRDHSRYRLIRRLGEGGMGAVYLAEHRVMERVVAIKVINRAFVAHPEAIERFTREIKAVAKLDHPNIAKAHDAEQAGELQLLAMEYVEGKSLADVLAKKGPLPIPNACHYVRQAALGLQHAFERGMVHRDLKPQNLMLTPQGVVKVLDFGLAKLASESARPGGGLTQDNMMMGTPQYMAPEQAVNTKGADIRADIYALGCTLYCLLTGRPPFAGDSLAVIVAHATDAPPPVESLRPEVPTELATLVHRLLAKNPNDRPQTPKELAAALLPFVKATSVKPAAAKAAAPEPAEESTWAKLAADRKPGTRRPAKRPPWLPAAIAAGVVLIGIGLWAGGVFKVKTRDGVLVVNVNEPNAEVFVDNERVTVSWANGGKTTEIRVKPGTRKVEVKKDGFSMSGDEVAVGDGGRGVFTATLEPLTAPPPPPRPMTDGFVSLFNGKDLTGWYVENGDARQWGLEGDAIVGRSAGYKTQNWLLSTKEYANFTLQLEFMIDPGGNGAIVLRGIDGEKLTNPPNGNLVVGHPMIKLTDSTKFTSYPLGTTHWLKDDRLDGKPNEVPQLATGEWHPLEVTARGDTCIVSSAGKQFLDVKLDPDPSASGSVVPGLKRAQGKIGFQTHTGTIRFRNVRIKELPPADGTKTETALPVVAPAPPVTNGFVPLFNSKDLTGWKRHPSQPDGWTVENRILIGRGAATSHLYSERDDYKNVRFRVEVRITEMGNSGQLVRASFGPMLPGARNPLGLPTWPRGYEADINCGTKVKTGSIWLCGEKELASQTELAVPHGQWFTQEITVMGNRIEVTVNGQVVSSCTAPEPHLTSGHLALQVCAAGNVGKVEFRKVEVQELPAGGADANPGPAATPLPNPPDPPAKTELTGGKVFLSDLQESDWHGNGRFLKNGEAWAPGGTDFNGIKVNGEVFRKALGTHPYSNGFSSVKYKLDGLEALEFETNVAIGDAAKAPASKLTFEVIGDGKVLWQSKPVQVIREIQNCSVKVQGISVLELRVNCPGLYAWAHAVWLDPFLVTTSKATIPAPTVVTTTPAPPVPAAPRPAAAPKPLIADLGGSVKVVFAGIPAGSFTMGSPKAEQDYVTRAFFNGARPDWLDFETEHDVTISRPFYLGAYTVTVGQFKRFVADTRYKTEAERSGKGSYAWDGKQTSLIKDRNWRNPGYPQTDDHPVTCVSWNDAVKFAEWLSGRDKHKYRLPTEAEWEYACRGGRPSNQPFGIGNGRSLSYGEANFNGEIPYGAGATKGVRSTGVRSVGSFIPNDWGLYDMHGNVREWCSDWRDKYPAGPVTDPTGPVAGARRVVRGQGPAGPGYSCRAANRSSDERSFRHVVLGFRLVREALDQAK